MQPGAWIGQTCEGLEIAGIAHCVGSLLLTPTHRTTDAQGQEVLEVNLGSAIGVIMAVPGLMPKGGAVVFVSSVAATLGLANHEAIAVTHGQALLSLDGQPVSTADVLAANGIIHAIDGVLVPPGVLAQLQ